MNDGAKSLYGALIGAGGSGGGSTPSGGNELDFYVCSNDPNYEIYYTAQYACISGMTWEEFVASKFNPMINDGAEGRTFSIYQGKVKKNAISFMEGQVQISYSIPLKYNDAEVLSTDTIIAATEENCYLAEVSVD